MGSYQKLYEEMDAIYKDCVTFDELANARDSIIQIIELQFDAAKIIMEAQNLINKYSH